MKKKEEHLKEAITEFEEICDSTPIPVIILNNTGTVRRANKSAVRQYGYGKDEFPGLSVTVIFNGDTDFTGMYEAVKTEPDTSHDLGEFIHRKKDGTLFPVRVKMQLCPIREESPIVMVPEDVTEQKKVEKQLHNSEEFFNQAISQADAVPYRRYYDVDKYDIIGEGIYDLTGYGPEEFSVKLLSKMIRRTVMRGEAEGVDVRDAFQYARDGKVKKWRGDICILNRFGEERWISDTSIQISDDSGKQIGSVGILQDITYRKQMQEEAESRIKYISTLHAIAESSNTVKSIRELALMLLDNISRAMTTDAFAFIHYDEDREAFSNSFLMDTIDGKRTFLERRFTAPTMDELIPPTCKNEGAKLILRTIDNDQAPTLDTFGDTNRRSASLMFVPIMHHKQIEGVISVQSYKYNAYSEKEFELLKDVANVVGGVLSRLHADRALKASEEKFRYFSNYAYNWEFWLDSDGGMIFTSPSCEAISGYSVEDFMAGRMSPKKLVHPKDLETVSIAFHEMENSGKPKECRHRMICKDGGIKWIMVTWQPVLDGQGSNLGVRGSIIDITERVKTEEAVRRQALMLESVQDAVIVTDLDGALIYSNDGAKLLFGSFADSAVNGGSELKIPDEMIVTGKDAIYEMQITGGQVGEWHGKRNDGSEIWVDYKISELLDEVGNPLGFLNISRDITHRKHAEEELRVSRDSLAQAQKMQTIATMAGGVAHDFNNLLVAITGGIDWLKQDMDENHPDRSILSDMDKAAWQMANLTRQLLAYARGGMYSPRAMNLNDAVIKALLLVERKLDKRISVFSNTEEGTVPVFADTTQVEQVITNLLINAGEAIGEKPGEIYILTETVDSLPKAVRDEQRNAADKYVHLQVRDTGKGMDSEVLSHIFEPFYSTKFTGRGLGLAATYGIVKNHSGFIYASSKPGMGTSMDIYLPATDLPVEEEKRKVVEDVLGGDERILVIDDEPLSLKNCRIALEKGGYTVLEADSAEEARRIVEKDPEISLCVLDMILPDMPGYELYPIIKGMRPDMKVVVCSGYDRHGPAKKVLENGANGFVQKPFVPEHLRSKVRRALNED